MRLAHTRISVRATRTQDGFDFCPESDVVLNVLRAACSRAGVRFQEVVSLPDALAPDTQRKLRERARACAKANKPDDGPVIMDQDEVFALWGCPAPAPVQAPGAPLHRKGRPLVRGVVPVAAPTVAALAPQPAETPSEPAPQDPGRWGTSNGRDEPCRLMDEMRRRADMPTAEISPAPVADPPTPEPEEISWPIVVEPAPSGARIRGWGMRGHAAPCAVGAGVLVDPARLAPKRAAPVAAAAPRTRKPRKAPGVKLKAPPRVSELAAAGR